jgi:hypothetical protein
MGSRTVAFIVRLLGSALVSVSEIAIVKDRRE